jgi:putative transposase
MTEYRRANVPRAGWIFMVNLVQRDNNSLLVDHIDAPRGAIRKVRVGHPFRLDASVIFQNTYIAF